MLHDPEVRRSAAYSFNCFNGSTYFGVAPSLPMQIAAAAHAGYDAVGLDVPSLLAHETAGLRPEAIGEQASAAGVPCYELVPLTLAGTGPTKPHDLANVKRLARSVGAKQVLATSRGPLDVALAEVARRSAGELADAGVGLALEFMATTTMDSLDRAMTFLDEVRAPNLSLVLDAWHLCLGPNNWEAVDALPLESIGFVQLGDALKDAQADSLDDSLNKRVLPGEGSLPLTGFRDAIKSKGFRGVVSVEVLSQEWRGRAIEIFTAASLASAMTVWEGIDAQDPVQESSYERELL